MRKTQRIGLARSIPPLPKLGDSMLPPLSMSTAMEAGDRNNEQRRAVEALAQALYESEDPGGIAWAKRTQIVRDPWLLRARRQLKASS